MDDWVLCRIRHKSNNPRSTWKDLNTPATYELAGHFQYVDDSSSKSTTNPNLDMVRDYFYKDCPMLPYIFASQETPNCMETTSSISFQSNDNVNSCGTSIHEYYEDSNKKNDQFSIPISEIMLYSNPLKRKHAYRGNNYESDLPTVANKKMMIGNREHEKKEETEMSAFNHESSTICCWSAE